MVYSYVGSSDLFLILGCMNLYLSFSTLRSSFSWRTDTIIFAQFDKPLPSQIIGVGGGVGGFTVFQKRFAFGYQHVSIAQFISLFFRTVR